MTNLNARTWLSLSVLAIVMGLLIFVPAWSIHYWQAWVYLTVFTGMSGIITVYLMRHDRALLERRMKGGPQAEHRPAQKLIMVGISIGLIALLVVPALDFRLKLSAVPVTIVLLGDILVMVGRYFVLCVYRENPYSSGTIEIIEGQRLASTGPYAIVRHPMYASTSLYLVGTSLALGSYWGLLSLLFMVPFLLWRIVDEERFLSEGLAGYREYRKHVRYRLVPFVW